MTLGLFKVWGFLGVGFFFLFLSRLLEQRCWKSIFKLEILITWCIKIMGQWLLEYGFPHTAVHLAAGVFHIRISCILVLGRISFIVLLSAQLCCVPVLRAMDRCSLGKKKNQNDFINCLWNSCSSCKILVARADLLFSPMVLLQDSWGFGKWFTTSTWKAQSRWGLEHTG